MRSWTKLRVLFALGLVAPVIVADIATAQVGPHRFSHDHFGSWGGYPYGAGRANTMSRIAADQRSQSASRAMQQNKAIQMGIRNTLTQQSQARTQAIGSRQQQAKDWWFQHQQQQLAQRQAQPQGRSMAVGPVSGAATPQASTDIIQWPSLLQGPGFSRQRTQIEAPYRDRASKGDPTPHDFQQMVDAASQMKVILQGMVNDVTAGEYLKAEKFIEALASEAQAKMKAVSPSKDSPPKDEPGGDQPAASTPAEESPATDSATA